MKQEPHDLVAEAAVLGSIIIDNKAFKEVNELLSPEDFYDTRHEYIYRGMVWLDKKDIEIDVITLHNALQESGYAELAGGAAYLTEMTNEVITSTRVMTHAKIVSDLATKRRLAEAGKKISEGSLDGKSLEETMEVVQKQIAKVNNLGGKSNKYKVASMMEYIEESKERFKNWGQMHGLSTGFPSIDELTLGLAPAELVVIAGATSKGKTLLAMNMANNIAKQGGRVLFVTLEMTHAELTSRYMFVNGGWDTEDFAKVSANTIFQENDELNWEDVDGLMANAKEELDVDIVIIDHLHYFTRELNNVAEDLGRITKEFKKNAKRYEIPVILISHIRKLGKDEKVSQESLRGSSYIGQDSDIVLLVDRDPETNAMGVLIDKNRNRGKLSDRTDYWAGKTEREINTVFLDFNKTRLEDRKAKRKVVDANVDEIFPGAEVVAEE